MGLELQYENGQTPIDGEEMDDLLLPTISTRGELDEFEQANIEQAIEWTMKISISMDEVLSIGFIKELHKRMFSEVWGWAGSFRRSNKNIGVDKYQIELELTKLMDDCKFWIENNTFSEDEIVIRFKHRLVKIHPFPNGNGRHSRLCADILISKGLKNELFTWGSKNITDQGETRTEYLNAIFAADKENIIPLLKFART